MKYRFDKRLPVVSFYLEADKKGELSFVFQLHKENLEFMERSDFKRMYSILINLTKQIRKSMEDESD